MKKVLISAVVLFLMTTTNQLATAKNNHPSFDYSVYTTVDQQIHVTLEKQAGSVIRIEFLSPRGEILVREYVRKNQSTYRVRFNVDQLKDGEYQLVISDGKSVEKRKVSLATSKPILPVKNIELVD